MNADLIAGWFRDPPNPRTIMDVDGWVDFVARRNDLQPPRLLTAAAYEALTAKQRALYNLGRRKFLSNLPKHDTPMTRDIRRQIETTLSVNALNEDPGVRPGIFVSAESGLGKSTLMRDIAAAFEEEVRLIRSLYPNDPGHPDRWIPVVWINVPPKVSIRALSRRMITFYNEPPRASSTEAMLTDRAQELIRDCGTRLIVLDDITRLKMHREADQDASDWIRNLQETSATIIGIGVNVEGSGLLYEGTVSLNKKHLMTQTRRRFSVYPLTRFSYDSSEDIEAWVAHLKAVEEDLPLMHKQPGMLSEELAEFLIRQTGGVIGTLTRYIAEAATAVIGRASTDGGEHLTEADFLRVRLDHAAEDTDEGEPPSESRTKSTKTLSKRRNGVYGGSRKRGVA